MRKVYYNEKGERVKLDLPEEIKPYVIGENVGSNSDDYGSNYGDFNTTKYYFEFLSGFFDVIHNGKVPLPSGLTMSTI